MDEPQRGKVRSIGNNPTPAEIISDIQANSGDVTAMVCATIRPGDDERGPQYEFAASRMPLHVALGLIEALKMHVALGFMVEEV